MCVRVRAVTEHRALLEARPGARWLAGQRGRHRLHSPVRGEPGPQPRSPAPLAAQGLPPALGPAPPGRPRSLATSSPAHLGCWDAASEQVTLYETFSAGCMGRVCRGSAPSPSPTPCPPANPQGPGRATRPRRTLELALRLGRPLRGSRHFPA